MRHGRRALFHGTGYVITEQRGKHSGLTPGGEQNVRVVRKDTFRALRGQLRQVAVRPDAGDVGLQADRHGRNPMHTELGRGPFAMPG